MAKWLNFIIKTNLRRMTPYKSVIKFKNLFRKALKMTTSVLRMTHEPDFNANETDRPFRDDITMDM